MRGASGGRLRAYGPSVDLSLVDAVLASPRDEAPRLALAERLTEQGDPIGPALRATLGYHGKKLSRSSRSPLAERIRVWVGEIAEIARNPWKKEQGYELSRGFVEEVHLDAQGAVAHLNALRATWPVHTLHIRGRGNTSERIDSIDPAGFAGLHWLDLTGMSIDRRGAAWLADRPELASVYMLWLNNIHLDDESIETLYRSPWLARVPSVDLNSGGKLYEWIQHFTWSGALPAELQLTDLGRHLLDTHGPRPWFPPRG